MGHEQRFYPGDVCFRCAALCVAVPPRRPLVALLLLPCCTASVPASLSHRGLLCACRMADAIVINKANTAPAGAVEKLKEAAAKINPGAAVRAATLPCMPGSRGRPAWHFLSHQAYWRLAQPVPKPAVCALAACPPACLLALQVYVTDSDIVVDAPELVKGKRVVLIEDGPTLTHGGMAYGAGKVRRTSLDWGL